MVTTPAQPAAAVLEESAPAPEGRKRRAGFIVLVVLIAFAVFYATRAIIDYKFGSLNAPGPALFPALVGVLLLAGAVTSFVGTLRGSNTHVELDEEGIERAPSGHLQPMGLIGLGALVAYSLLLALAGSTIACLMLAIAVAWAAGQRTWWKIAAVAIILTLVMQVVFVLLLRMPLPSLVPGSWWL